jgi:hypothetical protein
VALFAQRWSPIEALRQSAAHPRRPSDAHAPVGAEPRDLAPSPVTATSSVAAEPASLSRAGPFPASGVQRGPGTGTFLI